jgi:hypothetical protein
MSLSDFVAEKAEVRFKGGSFDVRGLSLSDLSLLLRSHVTEVETIFTTAMRVRTGTVEESEYSKLAMNLLQDAPVFIATLIAQQADAPEAFSAAVLLPMPVQLDALEKIATLTFEEYGGVGKFVGSLESLIAGMRPSMSLPPK